MAHTGRNVLFFLAGVIALCFFAYCLPDFVPELSRVKVRRLYFDVVAGRKKTERYFFGIRFGERVEETDLSRAFRIYTGEPGKPVWKLDTVWEGGYSGQHSSYSRFSTRAREFLLIMEICELSDGAKGDALRNVFSLLEGDPTYEEVAGLTKRLSAYAHSIEAAREQKGADGLLEANELPPVPESAL